MNQQTSEAFPGDYDANPDRFRTGSESPRRYGQGDIHESVAERIAREQLSPVLDLGCGEGRLCRLLQNHRIDVVGLDRSPTMLSRAPTSRVLGDVSSLPFGDRWFGAVAALYVLYHVQSPVTALAESRRVLRRGGLFVTAAPNRNTDPELAEILPPRESPFDAEDAPHLVRKVFARVEVQTWDAPLVELPTLHAVEEYLFGRGLDQAECGAAAGRLGAPLTITKRGCLVWAYNDG